jgi:hypothetical protein
LLDFLSFSVYGASSNWWEVIYDTLAWKYYVLTQVSLGVAVGAGEIGEETLKELTETKEKLQQTLAALSAARDENRELRRRAGLGDTGTEATDT